MTETTRTADRSMSEEMKSLLAPTIESGSSWRDLFLLPMAALLLAMLIGALIMAVLTNGLRVLSVAQEWQTVVTGAIIILAVYADMMRRKRSS